MTLGKIIVKVKCHVMSHEVLRYVTTSSDTFTAFLWIFYNPLYSIYRAPPTFWFDILSFAVMWGMENVCDLAYRELDQIVDHPLTTSTRWLTMHTDEDLD